MARPQTKVSANQARSIVSRYGKGEGLVALADDFKYGIQVIRRVLIEAKVKIRGRGRPAVAE
jgi:hypothetical protein